MKSRKKINKKIVSVAGKIPFVPFLYVQYKKCINYIQFLSDLKMFNKNNDVDS